MNEVTGYTTTYQEAHQHTKWRRIPAQGAHGCEEKRKRICELRGVWGGRVSDARLGFHRFQGLI